MSIGKRYLNIAIATLMIMSAMSVLIYYMPLSDAGAGDVTLEVTSTGGASREIAEGGQASYLIKINNLGSSQTTYNITRSVSKSPSSWVVTQSQSQVTVASRSSAQITVIVRAPSSNTTSGSYCYATIYVNSTSDSNEKASVLLSTLIKPTYGASITSPGTIRMNPNQEKTIAFYVKNEGNVKDGFDLEVTSTPSGLSAATAGWSTTTFVSGSQKLATLSIIASRLAKAGTNIIEVKATSIKDKNATATRTIQVFINQTYNVIIESSPTSMFLNVSESGEIGRFAIKVTNKGNGLDSYKVTCWSKNSDRGWDASISRDTIVNLAANASSTLTLEVTPPSKANDPLMNEKGEFQINVSSTEEPSLIRKSNVSAKIKAYYDATVENRDPSTQRIDPDSATGVYFRFYLNNTGNAEDDYSISVDSPVGFDTSVSPLYTTIAAGGSRLISVNTIPQETVVKRQSYGFTLNIDSDNGVSQSIPFRVSINQNYGTYIDALSGTVINKAEPGNTYYFPLRVQNTGNGQDTISLMVEGSTPQIDVSWTPYITTLSNPKVNSEAWFNFNVSVSAPNNATQGDYRFYVKASASDGSYSDINLTVSIPTIYGVDITANKETITGSYSNTTGDPKVKYFDLNVFNQGSSVDPNVKVRVKTAPQGFAGLYSIYFTENDQNKISIPYESSKAARLEINMPTRASDVLAGTYVFVVEAISDNGTQQNTNDDKSSDISLTLVLKPLHDIEILTVGNTSKVEIGGSVVFTATILNTGTSSQYYLLALEKPLIDGVTYQISKQRTKTLSPLDEEEVNITINVAEGTNPNIGQVWVKLKATHPTDSSVETVQFFTATFQDKFSGDLSTTDNYEQAEPGNRAWYNLTLRNTGTRDSDTFKIEVEPGKGDDIFDNIEIKPSTVTLAPNQVARISINITVPSIEDEIVNSGIYEIVFKATSQGETAGLDTDDVIVGNETLKLKVMPVYRIQFLIPAGSANVDPGDTINDVKLNITNKGNEPTTMNVAVDLSTESGIRRWATISPSTVSDLPADGSVDVLVDIRVPTTAMAGKEVFIFQVSTANDATIFETAQFEVVIEEEYEVDLYVSDGTQSVEADPTDTVNFMINLKNKGNIMDDFEIKLSSTKTDWVQSNFGFMNGSVQTNNILTENVPIDGIRRIWMRVDIPENAPAGPQDFTITAKSLGDEAIDDEITMSVDVSARRDVELLTSVATEDVTPEVDKKSTEVEFTVYVANKGEDRDSFKLEIIDQDTIRPPTITPEDWAGIPKTINPTWVTLEKTKTGSIDKNGQEAVIVTVEIPENYYDPMVHSFIIWAYSEGDVGTTEDDKYSEPLTLKVDIQQTYGGDIIVPIPSAKTLGDRIETENILYRDFVVRVQNTGTGVDTFKLEIDEDELPSDADVITDDTYATSIQPGDYGEITITIELPPTTPNEKYNFMVRWISQGDDTQYSETEDYVTNWEDIRIEVQQTYGVDVVVDQEVKDGQVGEKTQFKLTIQNLGNADDDFEIEIEEPNPKERWALASKTKFTLGPKDSSTQSLEVTITIDIPAENEEAIAGLYDFNVTVRRDARTDNERKYAWEWRILTVDIEENYDHDISTDQETDDAEVGETVSFSFKVKNRGNSVDEYELKILGTRKEWGRLSAYTLSIEPEEEKLVYLNVTVPILGRPETGDTRPYELDGVDVEARRYDFTVEVASSNDENDMEDVTFTVDVEQEFRVNVPELDEATQESPKDWDVNDRDSLEIKFYVENLGNTDDTFKIKPPSVMPTGWRISVSPTTLSVPMGDSKQVTATITFYQIDGLALGVESLRFQVQPDQGSLTGRKAQVEFRMYVNLTGPELSISEDDVDVPSDPIDGNEYTIKAYVRNSGMQSADDVTVVLYDNDVEVGTSVDDVSANGRTKFEFKWTASSGDHNLRIVVNEGFSVLESNEDNNEVETERSISAFQIEKYLDSTILLIVAIVALLLLLLMVVFAVNKNREAKALAAKLREANIGGDRPGGPRKVIKEAPGAPAGPKSAGSGLPSAPGAGAAPSLPARDEKKAGKEGGKKEMVRVQCPKCKTEQIVNIDSRPAEVPCKECGVTLVIPEKK